MSGSDLTKLRHELKGILEGIQKLKIDLEKTDNQPRKTEIEQQITQAETSKTELKEKIMDTIEADCLLDQDKDTTGVELSTSSLTTYC